MLEARCSKCSEIFIPNDEGDIKHIVRSDGKECGGISIILGEYIYGDIYRGICYGEGVRG